MLRPFSHDCREIPALQRRMDRQALWMRFNYGAGGGRDMEATVNSFWATFRIACFSAAALTAGHGLAQQVAPESPAPATVAAPAAALSPFAAALRAAIDDPQVLAFYQARDFAPLWADATRTQALLTALRGADAHALPAARYAPDRLATLAPGEPATEAALTAAFLQYARDVSSGALEPRRVNRDIKVRPPRPEIATLLSRAAGEDMAALLASLPPQDPGYAALKREFERLTTLAVSADWGAPVPAGPTLRRGESGPRVAILRERLARLGFVAPVVAAPVAPVVAAPLATAPTAAAPATATASAPAPTAAASTFDAGLEAAVLEFQRAFGLIDDGAVGPATLAALNAGPAKRAGQIAVNLERARWMNRPLGDRRIMVNLPDYTVTLIDNDRVLFHERVVIGMTSRQTPEFSDEMEFLVLNPTWFVPRSIATKDLLPQLQQDPEAFLRRGMRLIRTDGAEMPADLASHDFSIYDANTFPYRIRQQPSDDNALGAVKFMFPNDDAIYLHDTPRRSLFNRDVRAFSSGCIRVRDPLRLAELLFEPQRPDARAFVDGVIATGRERTVYLDQPVPVHLIYRTAWVDETGALQLRGDVYGRDADVLNALRALGLSTPEA
jgi:murein L,D-transpeptidase YcbB/YkuD